MLMLISAERLWFLLLPLDAQTAWSGGVGCWCTTIIWPAFQEGWRSGVRLLLSGGHNLWVWCESPPVEAMQKTHDELPTRRGFSSANA